MGAEHTPGAPNLVIQVSEHRAGRWTLSLVTRDAAYVERMSSRRGLPLDVDVAVWPSEHEQMVPVYRARVYLPAPAKAPPRESGAEREAALDRLRISLAFASFTCEWRRAGMPGEPRLEPDGAASVEVEAWGVRTYYRPAAAVVALGDFPTTEEADEEAERAICDALHAATIRSDPTCCSTCGGDLALRAPDRSSCNNCGARWWRGDHDCWRRAPAARALVKDGVVLGMGLDDDDALADAKRTAGPSVQIEGTACVDATLEAWSGGEADEVMVAADGRVGLGETPKQLVAAGDHCGLWMSLLSVLPRCSDDCGRTARFMTTYTSQFSCGQGDRGCTEPDDDGWEEAPWKAHVDAAAALTDRGAR